MPDQPPTVEALLSMLSGVREDGPGAYRGFLPIGRHELGVLVSEGPTGILLRAYPEDVIPAALTGHLFVRQRLAQLGDIVAMGRLTRDPQGRLALEMDLVEDEPRQQLVTRLKRLTIDCARLRGAAEGLAATAPEQAGHRIHRGPEPLEDVPRVKRVGMFDGLPDSGQAGWTPAPPLVVGTESSQSLLVPPLLRGGDSPAERVPPAIARDAAPEAAAPAPPAPPAPASPAPVLPAAVPVAAAPAPPEAAPAAAAPPPLAAPAPPLAAPAPPPSPARVPAAPPAAVEGTRMFTVPAELFAENPGGASARASFAGAADVARRERRFVDRGAALDVRTGPSSGEQFVLDRQDSYCIGRSPEVDITLNDRSISRRNSLLRWVDDGLWIEDLNSSNGTRVNGKLATRVELHPGDVVEVGETTFEVVVLDEAGVEVAIDEDDEGTATLGRRGPGDAAGAGAAAAASAPVGAGSGAGAAQPGSPPAATPGAEHHGEASSPAKPRRTLVLSAEALAQGALPDDVMALGSEQGHGRATPSAPSRAHEAASGDSSASGAKTVPPESARPPADKRPRLVPLDSAAAASSAPAAPPPTDDGKPPVAKEERRLKRATSFFKIVSPTGDSGAAESPDREGEPQGGQGKLQRRTTQFDFLLRDGSGASEVPGAGPRAPAAEKERERGRGARGDRSGAAERPSAPPPPPPRADLFKEEQVEDALSWMQGEDDDLASGALALAEGEGERERGDEDVGEDAGAAVGAEVGSGAAAPVSGAASARADAAPPLARAEPADAGSGALGFDLDDLPDSGAEVAPTDDSAARPGGRLLRQGEEVLAWMDEVGDGDRGTLTDREPPRRRTFAIPKAILPSLRKIARDWYRYPERTTLSGEIRVEGDSIWVQSCFQAGESTWRYRRPMLRIGKPPVHLPTATYVPEPTELSHEEVASWLLSEGLVDETEVETRKRARALLEEAWVLRAEGNAQAALEKLEEVLALSSDDVMALTTMGHLCRKELDNADRAQEYYTRALELAPRFTPALLGRAMLLLRQDRHRAAEAAVQALALAPDDPDALELAGLITLRAGRRARAREIFLRLYRKDRERGRHALGLIDAERGGHSKWDPRLVMVERRTLQSSELDSITRALYEERVELADQLDAFIEAYPNLASDERARKLERLRDAQSYSFFSDLLDFYLDEPAVEVQHAIEEAFVAAPTPAAIALEDALREGIISERAVAATAIAAKLQWRDLLGPVLELYRHTSLPREAARLTPHLLRYSGAEVALALVAKLERGVERSRDDLVKLFEQRPAVGTEDAATALRDVLASPDALDLADADREFLDNLLGQAKAAR